MLLNTHNILALLVLSAAHLAAVPPASAMSVMVYNNVLFGVGAPHPSLDGGALNRICNNNDAQTLRVTSQVVQASLEEAMDNVGSAKAYLGAKYDSIDYNGDWVWMGDNWEEPHYPFCHGYSVPCAAYMYTNWAPDFPSRAGSATTLSRWLLHEKESNGWCNRQGFALTSYYVACSIGDTYIPTSYPDGPHYNRTESPGGGADSDEVFPKWALAIIIVGAVVLLAAIIIPVVICYCRRSRSDEESNDNISKEGGSGEADNSESDTRSTSSRSQRSRSSIRFKDDCDSTDGDVDNRSF